jgi:hypothetical protein
MKWVAATGIIAIARISTDAASHATCVPIALDGARGGSTVVSQIAVARAGNPAPRQRAVIHKMESSCGIRRNCFFYPSKPDG